MESHKYLIGLFMPFNALCRQNIVCKQNLGLKASVKRKLLVIAIEIHGVLFPKMLVNRFMGWSVDSRI